MHLLFALAIAGCGPASTDPARLRIGGATYAFPEEILQGHMAEESPGRDAFVRVSLPRMVIEHTARAYRPSGVPGAPTVAFVIDSARPERITLRHVGRTIVVCSPYRVLPDGCGAAFDHLGARWGVRFRHDDVTNAPRLVAQARHYLTRHVVRPGAG